MKFNNYNKFIDIDNQTIKSAKIPLKIVDEYPFRPFYLIEMSYRRKNFNIGLAYSFLFTGSSLDYADKSGEDRIDNTLHYNQLGIFANFSLYDRFKNNSFYPEFSIELGMINVKYISLETLTVAGKSQVNYHDSFDHHTYFKPGISLCYKFSQFIASLNLSRNVALSDNMLDNDANFRLSTKLTYVLPFGN